MRTVTRGTVLLAAVLTVPLGAGAAESKLRLLSELYHDSSGGSLRAPEAAVYDGKATLVVADTGGGRLVRYKVEGEVISGGTAMTLAELPVPRGLAVRASGEILVLDARLGRIGRVSPSGSFKGYLDLGAGADAGRVLPWAICLSREDLYVLDVAGGRVLGLAADGKRKRELAIPADTGSASDLAVDPAGTVFVLDSVGRKILVAGPGAALLKPLGDRLPAELEFPTRMASDGRGRLLVVDHDGGGIAVIGADGSYRGLQAGFGWKPGLLRFPSGISASPTGLVVVADRGNNRVQVFTSAP